MTKEERIKKYAKIVSKVNSAITDVCVLQDDIIDQFQDELNPIELQERSVILRIEKAISKLDIVLGNLEHMVHTSIEFPESF